MWQEALSRLSKRMMENAKGWLEVKRQELTPGFEHFGPIITFPIKVVLLPLTLTFPIIRSAYRGFGVPEFLSNAAFAGVAAVITIGTCDIAFDIGKKFVGPRLIAEPATDGMPYAVLRVKGKASGEKATAGSIADAVVENRAELVPLPSALDLDVPLPSTDCPTCNGTITNPPWKAMNVMSKMHYPYEIILDSMKDPSIAAFWLFTMPEVVGGFKLDDEIKQKFWWHYKDSMRYDQLRDVVAQRKPGWENLQEGLVQLDPSRARDDAVVVKNVPYFKLKKALEVEVMKLDPPPRPKNWGDLELPLDASSWSEEDLKDPMKLFEMTVLLNGQREIAEQVLDAKWEAKWRQEKLNEMLEEKAQSFFQNIDSSVLSPPIAIPAPPAKKASLFGVSLAVGDGGAATAVRVSPSVSTAVVVRGTALAAWDLVLLQDRIAYEPVTEFR
ncbi:hypothetical protein AKJ16_DCAP00934 [Drosera capensis]